jgi:molybdopterin synthase catalytic subunit
VLIHRTGDVPIGGEAVVVVVSAPHRAEAFDAARFGIDAVKSSVPIWKRERWAGGEDWGLEADRLVEPTDVDRHLHGVEAAS